MTKQHINNDGNLGRCSAQSPKSCKFAGNPHFRTIAEGRAYVENQEQQRAGDTWLQGQKRSSAPKPTPEPAPAPSPSGVEPMPQGCLSRRELAHGYDIDVTVCSHCGEKCQGYDSYSECCNEPITGETRSVEPSHEYVFDSPEAAKRYVKDNGVSSYAIQPGAIGSSLFFRGSQKY